MHSFNFTLCKWDNNPDFQVQTQQNTDQTPANSKSLSLLVNSFFIGADQSRGFRLAVLFILEQTAWVQDYCCAGSMLGGRWWNFKYGAARLTNRVWGEMGIFVLTYAFCYNMCFKHKKDDAAGAVLVGSIIFFNSSDWFTFILLHLILFCGKKNWKT